MTNPPTEEVSGALQPTPLLFSRITRTLDIMYVVMCLYRENGMEWFLKSLVVIVVGFPISYRIGVID